VASELPDLLPHVRPPTPALPCWPRLFAALLVCVAVLGPMGAFGQQPSIYYVYDALNRLSAVVDPQGNVGQYTYDAGGNILRIDRIDASAIPGTTGITLVNPGAVMVGDQIQIFGKGFSPTLANNTVTINGVTAVVTSATSNRLVITAPPGAATGVIVVTTSSGTATSSQSVRVFGTIAVTPTIATVVVGGHQSFTAQEGGIPTANVRWAVNGIPGGTSSTGTVSSAGLYTAPATVPSQPAVVISATDLDDATLSASALVTIIPSQPLFIASAAISFGVNASATAPEFGVGAISLALAPVITGMAPSTGSPGAMLSITVTGVGFTGATAIVVLLNNAPDPNIMTSGLVIDSSGTHATAVLTISSSAATGPRVVQIVTPARSSMRIGTGPDLFTVQ
jgi:YD repeat-containing protein